MAGIPGNATKEDIDKQLLAEVRSAVALSAEGGTVVLTHAQAQKVLELLPPAPEPEAEPKAGPTVAAAVVEPRKTRAQLGEMTKEELLAVAEAEGAEVTASWTKPDLIDAIVKRKEAK
jgi:hypothetical protein